MRHMPVGLKLVGLKPVIIMALALFGLGAVAGDSKSPLKPPTQKPPIVQPKPPATQPQPPSTHPQPSTGQTTVDLRRLQLSTERQRLAACVSEHRVRDCDGDGFESDYHSGWDCDDADSNRFPGNTEIADASGHDEDCDYTTYGMIDRDGDGHIDSNARNITNTGQVISGDDCNDNSPGVHPGVPEVCNQIDDDCDTAIDDIVDLTLYRDDDRDGFGDSQSAYQGCAYMLRGGIVTNDSDCDDQDPKRNPIGGC